VLTTSFPYAMAVKSSKNTVVKYLIQIRLL
jgi:hypothetical protein